MTILLIGFTKLKYMPYANFYLNILKKESKEIDFIYWNRDDSVDIDYDPQINYYKFDLHMEDTIPLFKKIKYFIEYRKFARNIIKKNKYEKIIVLHSTPAVLLFDDLLFKKCNYILDYRDVTYEYIKSYKFLIGLLVKKSNFTFISSRGFLEYLPLNEKIYFSHNIDYSIKQGERKHSDVIKVGYWGLIRHKKTNIKIIDELGNDSRFELHFYGREQSVGRELKSYTKRMNYNNVFFHGEYFPEDKNDFLIDTDIVHNVFDNDFTMKSATSNRFYDALLLKIPQICSKGSYMGNLIEEEGLGITLDVDNDFNIGDKIHTYFSTFDREEIYNKSNKLLGQIECEINQANDKIISFIDGSEK